MDTMQEESYDEVPEFIVEAFLYHKDAIQSVKVNPQNKKEILTGGLDNVFNVINTVKGKNIYTKTFEETIAMVDITKDGSKLIAACLDNMIYVYNKKDDQFEEFITLEGPDEEITFIETHS